MTFTRRAVGLALAVAVSASAGCTDEPSIEAFCERVERVQAAGPLFPDRTDGEPVADPAALAALRELDGAAPDDVATHTSVLLAEAEGLAAEAERRVDITGGSTTSNTTSAPTADRPQRDDVTAAQAAVTTFVADECGIELGA